MGIRQFKDKEIPISYVFVLVVCLSITINLSFLYYSGILDTTAKNLDEISKLTNAAGRVASGIADYLDVFHRLERLESLENTNNKQLRLFEFESKSESEYLSKPAEYSLVEKYCPKIICS